jgi:hypothetical protein
MSMEMAGAHPLTLGEPRSVAEAVAMRDGASVLRLLSRGAGPNEVELIRPGALLDRLVLATPLEAAVIVDEPLIFDVLAEGRTDLPLARLRCLAVDVGARAVLPRLGAAVPCEPGAAWAAVLDRP